MRESKKRGRWEKVRKERGMRESKKEEGKTGKERKRNKERR